MVLKLGVVVSSKGSVVAVASKVVVDVVDVVVASSVVDEIKKKELVDGSAELELDCGWEDVVSPSSLSSAAIVDDFSCAEGKEVTEPVTLVVTKPLVSSSSLLSSSSLSSQ